MTLVEKLKEIEQIAKDGGAPLDMVHAALLKMSEYREAGVPYGDTVEGFQKWASEQLHKEG